jgi:divalent metal cation (Fe/Co/Zn/Cd) transporter
VSPRARASIKSLAAHIKKAGIAGQIVVARYTDNTVSWQFAGRGVRSEQREARALRFVAVAFFALALYVAIESLRVLVVETRAETSVVGLILASSSLVVMPILSLAKRRTGRALDSAAVVADSTQTLLCTYLSGVLLAGLLLNTLLGWWWADPVAGLVIASVALREGIEAWRGQEDCC